MRHVAVRRIHTALEAIRAMESEFISAQVAVGAVRAPAVKAVLADITFATPVHAVVLPFAAVLAVQTGMDIDRKHRRRKRYQHNNCKKERRYPFFHNIILP